MSAPTGVSAMPAPLAELARVLPDVLDLDELEGVKAPARLRIEVLSEPGVYLDGRRVRFATRHAELGVYLLALAGTAGVRANRLSCWLWPKGPEDRWGPRLRTMLWQVRSALGDESGRLQRCGESVVLDLAGAELDLAEALRADVASLRYLAADVELDPHRGRGIDRPLLEGWGAGAMIEELGMAMPVARAV